MGKNSNILAFLHDVVQENTTAYQSDFLIDVETLLAAAHAPKKEDRCFYWMSRPHGTWCVKEREVFLKGSNAYAIWTHYDKDNEHFRAYRVVVTGEENGRITGDLYPLDYGEQIKRVKAMALPIAQVTGQYVDGTDFQMSFSEMNSPTNKRRAYIHGGIKVIHYEPKDEAELQARIMQEHHIQIHGQRKTKNPKHFTPTR